MTRATTSGRGVTVPAGPSASDIAEESLAVPPVPFPSPVGTPRRPFVQSNKRSSYSYSFDNTQTPAGLSDPNNTPFPSLSDIHSDLDTDRAPTLSLTKVLKMSPSFKIESIPPFQDPMESLGIQPFDVLKIKNVPYTVTIPEIKAFAGRLTSSPLIRDHVQGFPVHIIMERSTAKTMDCFVEFQHQGAAKAAVIRAEQMMSGGRTLKLGSRRIDVEISSEGELCAALFPRAKSTFWNPLTGIPTVTSNTDPYSEGFQGFLTEEEFSNICKHAANPQKSSFSQRCPQRVYESMMSTLYKYPWHVPENYVVDERDALWRAYVELLKILVAKVRPGYQQQPFGLMPQETPTREVGLSHSLLLEYLFAGMNAHMFSLRQKFMIVEASGSVGSGLTLPVQAGLWPFESLVPLKGCPSDILNEWLGILHAGYHKVVSAGNLVPGYAEYGLLGLDERHCLKVQLNELGRLLTFRDLISMEKGLMEYYIEHGRYEWCEANRVPYRPLNLWRRPNHELEHLFGKLIQSSSFFDQEPVKSVHKGRKILDKTVSKQSGKTCDVAETTVSNYFNPAIPSFIPRQPWSGAENNQTAQVLRFTASPSRNLLAHVLTPSRMSTQDFHVQRNVYTYQPPTLALPNQPHMSAEFHERVNENTSPSSAHPGASLTFTHRTTHGQNDQAGTSAAFAHTIRSNHDSDEEETNRINLSLPPKPAFGNIWGPVVANRGSESPSSYSEVLRRPNSAESFNASPLRGPGGNANTSPVSMASQRIPGRRSRSSTRHGALRIQATIHEEGDNSAAEAFMDPEDAADDAGGVCL